MLIGIIVILAVIAVWSWFAGRLARWRLTVPIALVAAGLVVGWESSGAILDTLDSPVMERGVEVVLAILLFLDATAIGAEWRRDARLLLRLVLLGVPLCLAATSLTALAIFPAIPPALALLLACITVPTDMAPAASILTDRRLPARLRGLLNVESGYNDAIVAPIFLFALTLLGGGEAEGGTPGEALGDLLPAALLAVVVGGLIGAACGAMAKRAEVRDWATPASAAVGLLAAPLLTYAVAVLVGGNGFVAAFVAGTVYRAIVGEIPHARLELAEGVSVFATTALWFVVGQLLSLVVDAGIDPRALAFSLLAVTLLRVVPVLLALLGSDPPWIERTLMAWLGPRGIASVVFALLALPHLPDDHAVLVVQVLVLTVVGSVVLHGLTVPWIAEAYRRHTPTLDPTSPAESAAPKGRP